MAISRPVIIGLVLLGLIGIGVGWAAGVGAALFVVAGLLLIAGTAWLPSSVTRALGALYVAFLTAVFTRATLGAFPALGLSLLLGTLFFLFAPGMVHRRVCYVIPSMALLVFVTTLLMYMAPGSPFASEKVATADVLAAKQAKFKVYDDPVDFFSSYMEDLVLHGSMGLSTTVQGRTVNELLASAFPVSASLGLLALVLAVVIGLFLGVRAGLKPNSLSDYTSMGLALFGISLPNFVIGSIFIIVFALWLKWLPVAGWGSLKHLVLPAFTLALPYAAYIARLARGGTIEVMRQDFIRTARAKGLPERMVVLKHALKGAMLPVVSFLGPAAAGIMTGSFVVEILFGIPGMGRWFVNGALNRDYSVVLGTALIYFAIITAFNLLVDFAYSWLDPRTRSADA